jgi:hypothetical protein
VKGIRRCAPSAAASPADQALAPPPAHLSLTEHVDAQYLNTERTGADKSIVINPAILKAANTEEAAVAAMD